MVICRKVIDQLKIFLASYSFATKEDEIYFFKEIKPEFCSQYIYFQKIFTFVTTMPLTNREGKTQFINKELNKIIRFCVKNAFFYQYYRSNASYLDDIYFMRVSSSNNSIAEFDYINADTSFTTPGDPIVSKILAYELFTSFLDAGNFALPPASQKKSTTLNWTDSKTGLIELAYALQSAGVFNNGKSDVKQIIDFFQTHFSIELGNTSRTFQEILSRKTGYANFLDRLRAKLLERIDNIENK